MTGLASLHPAYFAMVMATGIVSVACKLLGLAPVADALLAVNVATYAALWALTAARVARYPKRVFEDLVDHQRGVGFFTIVAATSVLGVQCLLVRDFGGAAAGLFVLSIALWVVLTYGVFAAFTVKETKPTLADGINGGWLVAVVATESIANLGGLLARRLSGPQDALHFFTLVFWLCGGMLYIWMISLIFYRYTFFHFSPSDLMPPYWINMGAMAISTLAGSLLIVNAPDAPFLESLRPFIKGFTIFYWATGTWWIPMLLVLGVWRHIYRRFPLQYDPLYWGAVFPLGMYAASTHELIVALDLGFLVPLPKIVFAVALAAWLTAFVGWLRALLRPAPP